MSFKKYMHVERLDSEEVEGLLDYCCDIQPKLDGANASIWWDNGEICCGSRNNQLSPENTLSGFYEWVQENKERFRFAEQEGLIIYGEWLIPHAFRGYREDAWRKFYIFDGYKKDKGYIDFSNFKLKYEIYIGDLLVPVIGFIDTEWINGDSDYQKGMGGYAFPKEALDQCTWLLKEGEKHEGVVIKRHTFFNKYGRQTWAKYVREDFKCKSQLEKIDRSENIESKIVYQYVTDHLIEKEIAKVRVAKGLDQNDISILGESLGKVWHSVINEELWNILKKFKCPTINFGKLKAKCDQKVKAKFGVKYNEI